MKKYLAARKCASAIFMAGALGTFTFVAPQMADAQNAPEKIQLMAETLRARDSGDLSLAKAKAEELIKIAPDDQNVQRLLASINKDLDRQDGGAAVFGQATEASVEVAMAEGDTSEAGASAADSIVAAAAADQDTKIAAAENAIDEAAKLAELGAYSDAAGLLNAASASLTLNTSTADVLDALEQAKADIVLIEAKALAASGDAKGAEALLEDYRAAGGSSKAARSLATDLDEQISDPYELAIQDISPEYVAQSKIIRDLLTRGRAQFLNGDYDGAASTFKEVEARDANNPEAKLLQKRIAEILSKVHRQNFYKTREQMLAEVEQLWERPKVFDIDAGDRGADIVDSSILQKMKGIVIPQVNFSGMELTRVIDTLSELSVEYDPEQVGVNIVPLFDANQSNPRVNISLRNLNLDRILEFVTQQVNFAYSVGADAVTVDASDATGGESSNVTEFFPISRATVIRLTGFRDGGGSSSSGPVDPFAAPSSSASSGPSASDEVEALQAFFQSAGVNFDVPGASLAFDGEQLIVTQTSRNLERMRVILRNYNEVKQVEIEAKFLEVTQGDLEELGFDWSVNDGGFDVLNDIGEPVLDANGYPTTAYNRNFNTGNRNLSSAFSTSSGSSAIIINDEVIASNAAPSLSTAIDLASTAGNLLTSSGWSVGGANVDLAIRALSRKAGSDLMSAPKVTVLSGKRATITVAQELRYPESYGDIESQASGGSRNSRSDSSSSSGGGSVTITAGTPQDFVTRNVGVEMSVTPNVENDDTISLILEPRVTEFEGFVEYGGPSVAISGETTVTVPAGFYQPIFSTREITTEVTVFDGATVVMGGLTRDEVKTVNDRVPVLGDIPGIGRLFRSEGESREKRNLLIFVTANLVSPGGSPAGQDYRNVKANSLFQNPSLMTPSGAVNRSIELKGGE
jgi:general secretion pathway protein D